MNRHEKYFVLLLIFIVWGVVISIQGKSIMNNSQKSVKASEISVLARQLEEEKVRNDDIIKQISELEKLKEERLRTIFTNQNNTIATDTLKEIEYYKLLAGLTDVTGPGIIITLDDAPARTDANLLDLIIHDSDIKELLNILRIHGAQALAINEERILATSKQICAGPTILINDSRYPVPYVIKAIGNSDKLYNAVVVSELVMILNVFDIKVEVVKKNDIRINKYQLTREREEKLLSGLEVREE